MNTLLLATDGSKPSLRAEEYISKHYNSSNARVAVVSVAYLHSRILDQFDLDDAEQNPFETPTGQALVEKSRDIAKDAKERLNAEGFEVDVLVRTGPPGRMICDVAKELSVDCIVVGRRGQSNTSDPLLGSVSQHLLRHSPCPVNVIPE